MPIVQISRIQHRRGKQTDLPQLAAGELGWVVDEQRLFIGNGTVADGAPAVGNTEIVTEGSSAFTTALSHTYKGYLGDSTPIGTAQQRTLQQRLDDYVSVKDFGAKGDDSTADVTAIQNAIDEIYKDTDKDNNKRSRRVLFFPAGTYRISTALKIPPFAHLVGEGPDKTEIRNTGNNAVMVTMDDDGNVGANIGNSGATTPQQIQISNMTLRNTVAHGGISLDRATGVFINNVIFRGSYVTGSDVSTSKGVTVNHSNATFSTSNVSFNQCQFTRFARLIDISYNATNVRFHACDFSFAFTGALIGAEMDGSTAGLNDGPRDVQFTSSSWSDIKQQAILVAPATGATDGAGPRHIVSHANFFAKSVANNFEGVGSIREVPIIQFDNDECSSVQDFFERTDLRRSDGSSELNAAPEVQGIGVTTKLIKSQTLPDNTSSATTINEFPALTSKGIVIKYKITRGTLDRTGEFIISASTTAVSSDDTFTESGATVGVTLSAVLDNKDSTAGNETVAFKFVTTSTGTAATIDYQTTIIA
jgi:hypothetical protein